VSTDREQYKGAKRRFETRVAVTLACIVAAVAIVAVFRRLTDAERLRVQQVAAEDWQSYQFKNIQRRQIELMSRGSPVLKRLQQEQQEIQSHAQKAERSRDSAYRKRFLLRIGQIALELALGLASLAIFIRRGILWTGAVASALSGIAIAAFALWS
jgi:uncharacterized membrane-anchored protein YhcB (DUF1043 family)